MPSQRPWQLAGGLEHIYRHPGPDRPPHCTGAGEVPVNYLTAFSVYSVAATLKCSGKLQPETGPPLECTEGGLAGMVRHEPCILDQTAILHQLTDWDIRGTSTPRGATTGSFHQGEHATHTPSGEEICRRFNFGKCAKGTECTFSHKCWVTGCGGDHSAKAFPRTSSPGVKGAPASSHPTTMLSY